MSLYIVKAKKTKLKANLSASASQITLDELVDSQGNAIVTASFGEWFVLVVKQGDQIEMIKCTAVTQNVNGSATITVATTGRNLTPVFPYVGVATGYSFLSGAEVIVTNDPLTVMSFTNKKNDETVEGLWTFNQTPIGLNAGAVNDASTTAKGIGRASANPSRTLGTVTMTIASPAVFTKTAHGLTVNDMVKFTTTVTLPTGIVAGTTYYVIATGLTANDFQLSASQGGSAIDTSGSQSGVHTLYKVTPVFLVDTDYRFGTNSFGVDSGTANAHILTLPTTAPTSYIGGDTFSYIVNVTNTTATTVNVAGLGVKTIKKLDGVTDLVAGDLVAGMIIEIEYNATSGFFMLKTPVAIASASVAYVDSKVKFGGTGADGALNVTSGTTTIDCASANFVIKNYTSINISVGATLAFSNPANDGTVVFLKSQGNVTIAGTINASGNGTLGGASGSGANGTAGTALSSKILLVAGGGVGGFGATNPTSGGAGATAITSPYFYIPSLSSLAGRHPIALTCGTGGGGGGGNGTNGAGGRGGGALYIECGGAWNFTGTINVSGVNGSAGAYSGGGGGGAGMFLGLYNTLTANSGTVTNNSGAGGNGGAGGNSGGGGGGNNAGGTAGAGSTASGAGGAGTNGGGGGGSGFNGNAGGASSTSSQLSLIAKNDYFV